MDFLKLLSTLSTIDVKPKLDEGKELNSWKPVSTKTSNLLKPWVTESEEDKESADKLKEVKCNECGMYESKCSCDHGKDEIEEMMQLAGYPIKEAKKKKTTEGFANIVKSAVGLLKKTPLTTAEKNAAAHAANKGKNMPSSGSAADDYDYFTGRDKTLGGETKVKEDDVEEGNAFSKAVRDAKKDGIQPGEKINVGGKKYPVKETTSADLMRRWTGIFEAEQGKETVKEGMGDDILRARFDTYVYDGMTPQQAAENLSKGFLARGFDNMTPEYILRVCAGSTAVTPKQNTATILNKAKSMLGSMYETEQGKETVDEGWDDMMAANKKQADDEKKSKGTGKFDKKTTTTGTEYTRKASTFDNGTEDPRRPAKTMQSKKDKKPMGESMEDCMTDDSGADDNFSINSSMDSSGHKSVSISASGSKADELTQILKNAGLGIMGSEDHAEPDADDMGGPSDHDVDNMDGGNVEVVSIPLAHHDGYQAPEPEVEVDEAAKWRAPEHKGKLYTQEPPDYNDSREYDNAIYDPKPDNYPGRKKLPAGGEYDRTDPLEKGYRRSADNSINTAGKRKGLPSRDQISSLKNSIRDAHGTHAQPNLPEAAGSIDFDKVLDAIAALYGDDMWENDAMQDLANDLAQAGPTDPELDFIIAKGRLPKRLANTQFSAGDNVQFGEAGAPMTAKQKSFADKIAGAKKEVDEEAPGWARHLGGAALGAATGAGGAFAGAPLGPLGMAAGGAIAGANGYDLGMKGVDAVWDKFSGKKPATPLLHQTKDAFGRAPAAPQGEVAEEYSNKPRTQVQPTSTQMRQGNDLNREKQQHKHSYRQGDNPMAMEDRQAAAKLEKELMEELSSLKVVSKKYAGKKLG